MKKIYYIVFCLFLFGAVQSQTSKIPAPASVQASIKSKINLVQNVSCGTDTIVYPYFKESKLTTSDTFRTDFMNETTSASSQTYLLNDSVMVHGIQFYGSSNQNGAVTNSSTLVRAYLYTVNGTYQPMTKIDSADVTIGPYDYYEAIFTTPRAVAQNFAVAVMSVTNDTLITILNNAGSPGNATNYGEGLGYRLYLGTWYPAAVGFGQDMEYLIFPIVSYDVDAQFTMVNDSACAGESLTFTNTSSPLLSSRVFNINVFNDYWNLATSDSTFFWNYGETSGVTYSMNGSHTYSAGATRQVSLGAVMGGYYTGCFDSSAQMIEVINNPVADFTFSGMNEPQIDFFNASYAADSYMWNFGDGSTSMAEDTVHTYTANGSYTVTLIAYSDFCGSDTVTQTITITTVGVADAGETAVKAYFNNESKTLQITSSMNDATVGVYDMLGQVISETTIPAGKSIIELNSVVAGTYIVRVNSQDASGYTKFTVSK